MTRFGWIRGGSPDAQAALTATALDGVHRRTFDVATGTTIGASICTNIAATASGDFVYGVESAESYPAVVVGGVHLALPQPDELAKITCSVFGAKMSSCTHTF